MYRGIAPSFLYRLVFRTTQQVHWRFTYTKESTNPDSAYLNSTIRADNDLFLRQGFTYPLLTLHRTNGIFCLQVS